MSGGACLDLAGNVYALGRVVWLYGCNLRDPAQEWTFVERSPYVYWATVGCNPFVNFCFYEWCLDAPEQYGSQWGHGVQIWACNPRTTSEEWRVYQLSTTHDFVFQNLFNGAVLDDYAFETGNYAIVDTWGWNGGRNQQWAVYSAPVVVAVDHGALKAQQLRPGRGALALPR